MKGHVVEIIISNSSPHPIYEQITTQIKDRIMSGELAPGDKLPSIRSLASTLHVSVITTKRAYADLEEQGFVATVPGKGCFIAGENQELIREERLREVERMLLLAIEKGRKLGLSPMELREMLDVLLESEE